AALLLLSSAAAAAAQRQRFSMDPQWRFKAGDVAGAEAPAFDDRAWRVLDLPHDWSIEGTPSQDALGGGQVGYFPMGVGWYRKAFRVPSPRAGLKARVAWLEFDGVYMNADVWLNGQHLGKRPYGYSSYAYDVSRTLVPGVNVVAVRVDNSRQPNSRWYSGSGIYRHTWLTLADRLHIAHWGTTITTPVADSARAEVRVRTEVENGWRAGYDCVLRAVVLDARGREVARSETPFNVAADGGTAAVEQRISVPAPQLWSPEHPSMYTLSSAILIDRSVADSTSTPFGIRTIAYDKDRGFLLNGKRLKMNGVNLHHDAGAVGAAVPEAVWERRLIVLKAMGSNAIRTSHNPPSPEFLDLCDRLGFLVMAEAFDEWTMGKTPGGYHNYFREWSERDVTDFVRRDRNHPSIVLWSAGNEIGEQTTTEGVQVLRRLVDIFHRADPTRPVTTGNDQIYADLHPALLEFLQSEDIVGYNYVDRWHERRELFAEPDRHDHPDWRMIGTESSSAMNPFGGSYSLGNDPKVVRPNYTAGMIRAEHQWKWVATHDYFAGDFMWTGIDYLGETRWPGKGAGSGPVDITGHPKDSYYLYQSQWTDAPVLHLLPHWSWSGREGQIIPVVAYSNCNVVELFLNGRSLGEQRLEFPMQGAAGGWNSYARPQVFPTTTDLHLTWDVPYEPGVLRAVGRRGGSGGPAFPGAPAPAAPPAAKPDCEAELRTAGSPAAIRLRAWRDTITALPGDPAQVEFEIVDSAGTVVPTADNLVHVSVSGGSLVALDNANLIDHDPYRTDARRAFNGRGLALARAQRPGTLRLAASADGLRGASIEIVVRPAAAAPAIPAANTQRQR
ncbi:MAG TPA: glycoside hydrolase family 2 TIM barrel-domain containing protein, partial [Longimicrobiales bacterium]